MICPHCQTDNPEAAQYCMHCGQPMEMRCPHCGQSNPPQARFCIHCGQGLKTEAAETSIAAPQGFTREDVDQQGTVELEGERRVVTILFCDVTGSTAMGEALDPEVWTEVMNRAFERIIKPIYRYQGTVARLMGDAVLAFFGAPLAHEDDPKRAVLAGLDIVQGILPFREEVEREYQLDFNLRVGINTGPVVVGSVGSQQAREYTAMGDAVNVAARMESAAHPGTVLVAENTYRLTQGDFRYEGLGPLDIKGKENPVRAYRPLVAVDRSQPQFTQEGEAVPFIGRLEEMRTLEGILDQVWQGRGHIVCTLGEAGIGKSRLLEEVRARWRERSNHPNSWVSFSAVSYNQALPYSLFRQALRDVEGKPLEEVLLRFFPLQPNSSQLMKAKRLIQPLQTAFVGELDSGSDSPNEAHKRQLFAGWLGLFRSSLETSPMAFAFDDLHWSDPASKELLTHLLQLVDEAPALFLLSFRPYRDSPAWEIKQHVETHYPHRSTELELSALDDQGAMALIDLLMSSSSAPSESHNPLFSKAEGNPLFILEVARALQESGMEGALGPNGGTPPGQVPLPDSLQALLTARIDRLESGTKRTVQVASVIGRTFRKDVLEEVMADGLPLEKALNELQRTGLVRETTERAVGEYSFQHELSRDAAYQTILHRSRKELHLQVGGALERLYPDRLEENAHRLADHFQQGGQPGKAAGYYQRAADAAYRIYANTEAASHYRAAIDLHLQAEPPAPDLLQPLFLNRGRALELNSDFIGALETYQELETLSAEQGWKSALLASLVGQCRIHCNPNALFDPALGGQISQQALQLAEELDDQEAKARILWARMNLFRNTDSYQEALEPGERSLSLARQLDMQEQEAYTLNDLSHVYGSLGMIPEAIEAINGASRLWRERGDKPMLADSLGTAVLHHLFAGNFQQAAEASEEAYRISQSIDNIWGISYSRMIVGLIYRHWGEFGRAIELSKQSIETAEAARFEVPLSLTRSLLSMLYSDLGATERAVELAQMVIKRSSQMPHYLLVGQVALGYAYLVAGQEEKAERVIQDIKGAARMQDPLFIAFASWMLVLYELKTGGYQRALQAGEERLAALDKYGLPAFVPETLLYMGAAQLALDRLDQAESTLTRAQREAEALGSRWNLWQILARLSALRLRQGHSQSAGQALNAARSIIEGIASNIEDQGLQASFLGSSEVKEVLEGHAREYPEAEEDPQA